MQAHNNWFAYNKSYSRRIFGCYWKKNSCPIIWDINELLKLSLKLVYNLISWFFIAHKFDSY